MLALRDPITQDDITPQNVWHDLRACNEQLRAAVRKGNDGAIALFQAKIERLLTTLATH